MRERGTCLSVMRERGTCLSEYVACLKQAGTDFNEQTFLKPNGKF